MPTLVISLDGAVVKEVTLGKERTTIGRRPYNDVVIDNLAVSGEHALLHLHDGRVELEDLKSTNGTYINGQRVQRQALHDGDQIEMGRYKMQFLHPPAVPPTAAAPLHAMPSPPANSAMAAPHAMAHGVVRVLSGPAAGREMELTKIVTTIGKPGDTVASITRRHYGYALAHVEGQAPTLVNGKPLASDPVTLKNGDRIELAGAQMEFVLI